MLRFDELPKDMQLEIRRDYIRAGIRWREFKECVAALVEFYPQRIKSIHVDGRWIVGKTIEPVKNGEHQLFIIDRDGEYGFVEPE